MRHRGGWPMTPATTRSARMKTVLFLFTSMALTVLAKQGESRLSSLVPWWMREPCAIEGLMNTELCKNEAQGGMGISGIAPFSLFVANARPSSHPTADEQASSAMGTTTASTARHVDTMISKPEKDQTPTGRGDVVADAYRGSKERGNQALELTADSASVVADCAYEVLVKTIDRMTEAFPASVEEKVRYHGCRSDPWKTLEYPWSFVHVVCSLYARYNVYQGLYVFLKFQDVSWNDGQSVLNYVIGALIIIRRDWYSSAQFSWKDPPSVVAWLAGAYRALGPQWTAALLAIIIAGLPFFVAVLALGFPLSYALGLLPAFATSLLTISLLIAFTAAYSVLPLGYVVVVEGPTKFNEQVAGSLYFYQRVVLTVDRRYSIRRWAGGMIRRWSGEVTGRRRHHLA